jgi:hypothetical protein
MVAAAVIDAWCDSAGDAYRCVCGGPLVRREVEATTDDGAAHPTGDCSACGTGWMVLPDGDLLVQVVTN